MIPNLYLMRLIKTEGKGEVGGVWVVSFLSFFINLPY